MFRIKLTPRYHSHAGNVAVRMRKVGGKAEGNRVEADLHNRDCDRGGFEHILHSQHQDNIRLGGGDRLQEFVQMLDFADPGVSLDHEVRSLLKAEAAQFLKKEPISARARRFIQRLYCGERVDDGNSVGISRLLRARREWPSHSRYTEERYELTPFHCRSCSRCSRARA